MREPLSLNFRVFTVKLVGVQKFRNFKVIMIIYASIQLHGHRTACNFWQYDQHSEEEIRCVFDDI